MKTLLCILAATLLLAACTRHSNSWATLDIADAVMEERPDSALSLLQGIDPSALTGDEEKARYALLMSMALDKNYIDTTTFDVLQPAIDYYLKHGTPDEKLRTYYYQGIIFLNRSEIDKALDSFINGTGISPAANDSLMIARTLVAQGVIYNDFYNFENYADCYDKAADIYRRLSLKEQEFDCLLNVLNGATLLGNKSCGDSILNICNQFASLSSAQKRTLAQYALSHATKFGSDDDIKALIYEVEAYPFSNVSVLQLVSAYNRLGCNDKAKDILVSLERNDIEFDTTKYLAVSVHVDEDTGNYKEALSNYKKFVHIHDSIALNRFNSELRTIEDKHRIEMAAQRDAEYRYRMVLACVCGIAVLFMAVFILLLLLRYNRVEKNLAVQEVKAKNLENDRLKIEREKITIENENLRLERDNKTLEAENMAHRIGTLERESERLKNLLEEQKELPEEVYTTIRVRMEMLNSLIAGYITSNEKFEKSYEGWVKEYTKDIGRFMDSNRLAFQLSHPRFIQYFEDHGLSVEEINYVCLYTMGLSGIEIGEYTKRGGHVNMSSAIRKKLGLGRHDTNIGKFVQSLFRTL